MYITCYIFSEKVPSYTKIKRNTSFRTEFDTTQISHVNHMLASQYYIYEINIKMILNLHIRWKSGLCDFAIEKNREIIKKIEE